MNTISTNPNYATTLSFNPLVGYYVDSQKSAGNIAWAYQNDADAAARGMVGDAHVGLNTALKNLGNVNGAIATANRNASLINNNADLATKAAMGVSTDIKDVRTSAARLNAEAENIRPFVNDLSGYGDAMWNQGKSLMDIGANASAHGNALLNLDNSLGGLSSEYVNWYGTLDPNRYVSAASSDVQQSFSNAMGQMSRSLSRVGSTSSSGNSNVLKQQYANALATALASAKTRARQAGLDAQVAGLDRLTSSALAMLGTGNDTAKTGLAAENSAADIKDKAAGLEKDIASIYAQAGGLSAQAGSLGVSQSNALTNAGQMYVASSNVVNQALQNANSATGLVVNASGQAASAQQAAMNYYAQVAEGFGQIAGAYGLFSGRNSSEVKAMNDNWFSSLDYMKFAHSM